MATGGSVIDTVLRDLDESISVPIFWTRAELLTHLNDGLQELNLISGKFQVETPAFVPTTATLQTTPTGSIAVLHVSRSSQFLRKRRLEDMDRENKKWMQETSAGNVIKQWGPVGLNLWFVYPKLFSGGSTLAIVTLDQPGTIGEGTTIALDEEYIDALEMYVFHMARFKEGGAEFQQSMEAYDKFREICGHVATRKMSEQYTLWSKEPAGETGANYGTISRS